MDPILSALSNLKQRKIVQWALAYAAVAWLFLEAFDLVAEQFLWPYWVRQGATVLVVAGLLVTLVLAWQHGERGRQRVGPGELLLVTILVAFAMATVWGLKERSERLGIEGPGATASFVLRRDPPPDNSIAVMPCTSLAASEQDTPIADGLAAELITRLSAVRELRVPSQTSSFSFKGRSVPIEDVATSLRVRHVLECAVTAEGSRIHVTVHLVDGESGYTLWSESYDREAEALLDLQREIAMSVVGRLQVDLGAAEPARLTRRWTSNPAAYDHFLRGIQFQLRTPTRTNVDAARRHFERAIELDPRFGRGYARLAINWIVVGNTSIVEPAEAYGRAKRYARRALELDDQLYEAYWARGWVALAYELDWEKAREDFRRTIDLAPSEFAGYHSLGYVEGILGHIEKGLDAARIAVDLDPISFYPRYGLEVLYSRRRDYASAVRAWEAVMELADEEPELIVWQAITLARAGQRHEARRRLAAAGPVDSFGPGTRLGAAVLHAVLGDAGTAWEIVDDLEAQRTDEELSLLSGELAIAHAQLGHRDEAMRWLQVARIRHNSWILHLDRPEFDSLRQDPRFVALIRQLGLPDEGYLWPRSWNSQPDKAGAGGGPGR